MACALATVPPDVEPQPAAVGSIVTEPLPRVTDEKKRPARAETRVSTTGEARLRTLCVSSIDMVAALTHMRTNDAKAFKGPKGRDLEYQRTGFWQEDFDFPEQLS